MKSKLTHPITGQVHKIGGALVEVFEVRDIDRVTDDIQDSADTFDPGFYWSRCDDVSAPHGPFNRPSAALADAIDKLIVVK